MSRRPIRALCLIATALGGCAAASPLRVTPGDDPTRVTVAAHTTHPEAKLRIALVDPKTGKEREPILADVVEKGDMLVLMPRYELTRKRLYRATLTVPGRDPVTADYRVPKLPPGKSPRVTRIYPTADRLPANLLKFYLHFSKPMRRGKYLFDLIQILDDKGNPVPDPWRRLDLWSDDSRRLTMWIHPGRIKTGVNLRRDLGPVLVPGKAYTLKIDGGLLDAEGRELGRTVRKRFVTTEADRTQPSIDRWRVILPKKAGSKEPLSLRFPDPLDRSLLERYLRVLDAENLPVEGEIRVGAEERSWTFIPMEPWAAGNFVLTADENLEDLAGNTPARMFDTDLTAPKRAPGRTRLPFRISGR